MEEQILQNIHQVFKSKCFDASILLVIVLAGIVVFILAIKFKAFESKKMQRFWTILFPILIVGLSIFAFVDLAPAAKDYKESSYIVLDNAEMVIEEGTHSTMLMYNRYNDVKITHNNTTLELKIEDYSIPDALELDQPYTCTVVYL